MLDRHIIAPISCGMLGTKTRLLRWAIFFDPNRDLISSPKHTVSGDNICNAGAAIQKLGLPYQFIIELNL